MNFLHQNGLDGLDIDYEYPQNKANFSQFVQELSAALQPSGLLLTAAVAAANFRIDGSYDVPALARYLDWINLMAYDFHGSWDNKTGHNAPYDETSAAVAHWQQLGMPANKIVLGFPAYGKSFTLSDPNQNGLNAPSAGPGQAGDFTREAGMLAYYEIMAKVNDGQMKLVNDANGSYAYGGNQWVSFDVGADFTRKIQFAKSSGIGGLMLWAPDFDDFNNGYPLLSILSSARLGANKWMAPKRVKNTEKIGNTR
jgi:chitinase